MLVSLNWRTIKDIVNNMVPGCISDDMVKGDDLENTQMVMEVAEVFLGVPRILDATDLVTTEVIDEKITIAYLSFFKEKVLAALTVINTCSTTLFKRLGQSTLCLWITWRPQTS